MPKNTPLNQLEAWQAAALLARREIKAVDLTRACLERIEAREGQIHAFAALNADAALACARKLDEGPIRGLLHGLPLGVKDIFDTFDMATECGSPIYARQQPLADAASVALCREAGAVVLGKTITTELANMAPGTTRNPHNLAHTPGGSSSGSAAAVADFMLPLALGTQTAGSVIRPAAFCGIVGFKPSHGRVPQAGVKSLSGTLDTIGAFGRSVRDVALLGAALTGDARLFDAPAFERSQNTALRIGMCQTPEWPMADLDTQVAWAQAQNALAGQTSRLDLPATLHGLIDLQKAIQAYETSRSLSFERVNHFEKLSPALQALLLQGMAISGDLYAKHLEATAQARQQARALFNSCDVILAPSAVGPAPLGLATTGDPLFCRTWTLLGLPCVHLPFTQGKSGLPLGLQLVGNYGDDHRLLLAAHCLQARFMSS